MDIVLDPKAQQAFEAFVNTIPTQYGRPMLNWWDTVKAQAYQAEKARKALEDAAQKTTEETIPGTEVVSATATEVTSKQRPIVKPAKKK